MHLTERLTRAFPSELARPAGEVASRITGTGGTLSHFSFEVALGAETVGIPERLYVDDVEALSALGGLAGDVAACLLSRHHNGYVRARALQRVLKLRTLWSMPFIARLIGEYVIEILEQIDTASSHLDPRTMRTFVEQNPAFVRLTHARVASYWDCYYRHVAASEYVGFRLIRRLEDMGAAHTSP